MVPKIVGLKACGSQILVELLNEEEILGTSLQIIGSGGSATPWRKEAIDGAPQAYVLDLGPMVNESWGVKVGDRIMFSTSAFIPAPNYDKYVRARGTIDPSAVKAVLREDVVTAGRPAKL